MKISNLYNIRMRDINKIGSGDIKFISIPLKKFRLTFRANLYRELEEDEDASDDNYDKEKEVKMQDLPRKTLWDEEKIETLSRDTQGRNMHGRSRENIA